MNEHQPSGAEHPEPDQALLVAAANNVLAARRALQGALPPDLVHNPAVELLLALFVAGAEGTAMTVEDAVHSTEVSPTVARRWITALEAEDLLARDGDRVTLSAAGQARVAETLRAMIASQTDLPPA